MGKLGGRELNYASDVDVLFVHDGDAGAADRAARRVLAMMSELDHRRHRVPHRRRPPARGPVGPAVAHRSTRTTAYYERWAQTWEFQALIKARPVAGDPELGSRFLERRRAARVARRPRPRRGARGARDEGARRGETARAVRASTDRELKRGRGGIRDIEFAVQLLQLVHGRHDTDGPVRAPRSTRSRSSTPAATSTTTTPNASTQAYRFLRTVEHRLQLRDEQQTHTLPADAEARTRARTRARLPRPRRRRPRSSRFEREHRRNQARRPRHPRAAVLRARSSRRSPAPGRLTPAAAEERLRRVRLPRRARRRGPRCASSRRASPRRSRVMQQLLPVLLEWLLEHARPRPRPAAAAPARRRAGARREALGHDVPRLARRGGADAAASSDRAGCSATRSGATPSSSRPSATTPCSRASALATSCVDEARRRRSTGAAIPSSAGRDSAASSAASCCASRHATCSASPTIESTGRELADLADACVDAALARARAARCRSR